MPKKTFPPEQIVWMTTQFETVVYKNQQPAKQLPERLHGSSRLDNKIVGQSTA